MKDANVQGLNGPTSLTNGIHHPVDVEQFLSGEVNGIEQELEADYESFKREFEHEQELEDAVAESGGPVGMSPVYYKAAIAVLLLLLLLITKL